MHALTPHRKWGHEADTDFATSAVLPFDNTDIGQEDFSNRRASPYPLILDVVLIWLIPCWWLLRITN